MSVTHGDVVTISEREVKETEGAMDSTHCGKQNHRQALQQWEFKMF